MSDKEKSNGGKARAMALELGEHARERAEELYDDTREVVEDGIEQANAFVRRQLKERPLVVAGTALGLGVLIGLALTSSSRR